MTNSEVRAWYRGRVERIRGLNKEWLAQGLSARERALRAWKLRRDARTEARAKMEDGRDVEALRRRDESKYGNPDGPSFEDALALAVGKGYEGDEAFGEIIRAALTTDPVTDQRLFPRSAP